MTEVNKKALKGILQLFCSLAGLLFLPAWTLHFWQAWTFLAVFFVPVVAITIYLMRNDPNLLQRRTNRGLGSEKEKIQKVIQVFTSISFTSVIVVPAIDHRMGWSKVPLGGVVVGDLLVALGLIGIFFVFKENTYTSAIIEVAPEQRVVSTGPYAVVRHPMYVGALVMLCGVPLALGSSWGLLTDIPISGGIVWRLLEEEKFLARSLPGYRSYMAKVRWRLVPLVW